jgi:putative transposase
MDAAKEFFKQALAVVGHTPEPVTTDGHRSYPRAMREIMGNEVVHRTNVYLNNRIEQDHRGMKQRYYPLYGFGNVASAARFCRACDELRHYFRPRHIEREILPLAHQRRLFRERLVVLQELISAVS